MRTRYLSIESKTALHHTDRPISNQGNTILDNSKQTYQGEISMQSWLAVGIGAALGAWLRWGLSLLANRWHEQIAFGTLLANLLGAFLMGMLLAWMQLRSDLSDSLKLLLGTGLLGGLTTFSAYSAESFGLLMRQQYAWALVHSLAHVVGALLMTALGFYLLYSKG